MELDGSPALVTGGGSGIGLACARRLADDGAVVTIAGRAASRLAGAAAGTAMRTVVCDVADEESVAAAVAAASGADGRLDLAVLAAGTGSLGPITSTPAEMWSHVMATNLTGAFYCVKHAGAAMARSGGGSIVAISSIAGPLTHRFMTPYCVSKAGLETLVRGAADELGGAGVRVNAVRPGLVPTELADPLVRTDAIRADYLDQMPLGRLGTVDDVASAVRYLLGPESAWVTGQVFAVDGGHTLRRGPDVTPLVRLLYGEDALRGVPGP